MKSPDSKSKMGRRFSALERAQLAQTLEHYLLAGQPVKAFAVDHDVTPDFGHKLARELGFSIQYVTPQEWAALRQQRKAAA